MWWVVDCSRCTTEKQETWEFRQEAEKPRKRRRCKEAEKQKEKEEIQKSGREN